VFTEIKKYYQNLIPAMQEEEWHAIQEKFTGTTVKKE
jgi:hypothetical protein